MAEGASGPFVSVSEHGGAATVLFERPRMNALSIELLGDLATALEELHHDPPGALVISGGRRLFAAGAEISELADPASAALLVAAFARACSLLATLPSVTIAAVNGVALGGGLELTLACDLRLLAQDARLGQPEVHLGLFPGAGGTQRLARLIGPSRTKELVFSGREMGADEALAIGLANAVHEPDALLGAAHKLAERLANGPRRALALAKRAIDDGLGVSLEEGLALERALFLEALGTDDARAGVESFFAHGPGHAVFSGR